MPSQLDHGQNEKAVHSSLEGGAVVTRILYFESNFELTSVLPKAQPVIAMLCIDAVVSLS